jgi:hypothetical protein
MAITLAILLRSEHSLNSSINLRQASLTHPQTQDRRPPTRGRSEQPRSHPVSPHATNRRAPRPTRSAKSRSRKLHEVRASIASPQRTLVRIPQLPSFPHSLPLFSTACSLFFQNTGVGGTPRNLPFGINSFQTLFSALFATRVPRPPDSPFVSATPTWSAYLHSKSLAAPQIRHRCHDGVARRYSRIWRKMRNRLKSLKTFPFRAVVFDAVWYRDCLSNSRTEFRERKEL